MCIIILQMPILIIELTTILRVADYYVIHSMLLAIHGSSVSGILWHVDKGSGWLLIH